MARKVIYQTLPNFIPNRGVLQVKVYRDNEWDELVCRLYINGKLYPNADYFSSMYQHDSEPVKAECIRDAIESAHHMAGFR